MGCSGSSDSAKKPAQQTKSGQQVQKSEPKASGAAGPRASEYKAPQDYKYPSLEPPVIDNKQALDKGYISSKGAGQTKLLEADKHKQQSASESDSDDASDDDSNSEDSDESDE